MYKVIDSNTWKRKNIYEWFSTFPNPCYGFNVKLDVSKVVDFSKKTQTSFFVNFLYIIVKTFNSSDAMRLRIVNGEIRLYDVINPAYTVATTFGTFDNGHSKWYEDYQTFYKNTKANIEKIKHEEKNQEGYNDSSLMDEYYISCVPWLEFESMTHPIPSGNVESCSVPRVAFGKFNEEKILTMNITVSHSLVDGKELSDVFLSLKENLKNAYDLLK